MKLGIRYCLVNIFCLLSFYLFGQFETNAIHKEHICWDKNNPDSARFFLVNFLPYKMGVIKDQQTDFLGVVDSTGNIQIPFAAYDTLIPMYMGKKNAKGRIIETVFFFTHKNSSTKMGSMDSKGNIILPNIYDYQEYTYAKTQILAIHENKKKIINTLTCKVDFETDLQAIISPLKEGNNLLPYWQIAKNGKKIIVSFDGNVLSDSVMYDKINSLGKYGYIKAELDGLVGLYNNNFKPITPIIYERVGVLKNGLISAKLRNGGLHLLDSAGNVFKNLPYDYIGEQGEQSNFYIFGQNGYVGLLDRNFQQIYPAAYHHNSFKTLHQGYFIVQRGDLQGLVDTLGKEITLPMFDNIQADCKGFSLRLDNGNVRYGYFEPLKNIFVPAIYENIYGTQQNYYVAKKQGFMGLLDTNFNEIVPFIYEEIQPIRGRYSRVDYRDTLMCFKLPNKTFFIHNLKNDSLYFTPYHKINEIEEGLFEVVIHSTTQDNPTLEGCMNLNMQEIVPCRYDFISVDENFILVSKNEKYGLWDKKGNEILPCKYAELKTPINYYDPEFEIRVKRTDDSEWEIYNVDTKTFSPY